MKQAYIQIKMKNENNELVLKEVQKQNLLDVLHQNNIIISNPCHGNGTCGKCKIKVLSGYLPITEIDRRKLTEHELEQGIRLACKASIGEKWEKIQYEQEAKETCVEKVDETEREELCIEIVRGYEEDIVVEGISVIKDKREIEKEKQSKDLEVNEQFKQKQDIEGTNCFIAIDIGTTTIAMALVNEETGEIIDAYTTLNHQRKYGADVVSRIAAANDGRLEELKRLIEEDLWKGICRLIPTKRKIEYDTKRDNAKKDNCIEDRSINLTQVVIAGNTTMIHLLMGYSCLSLGKYPFYSEHLEQIECRLEDCFSFYLSNNMLSNENIRNLGNCRKTHSRYNERRMEYEYRKIPVTILPGISVFVGGDIVAGILACPGFKTKDVCLLVDLGTNGEMVLGNYEKLMATSTAAGPAFEGGNITNGTAGIPGSIDKVKIQNQKAIVRTIKNEMPPIGICGTGLVSAVAQLKKNKLIDIHGNLRYPYSEKSFPLWIQNDGEKIAVYQKDIREFQMAKSAIRAGVEILMEEYGCETKDVKYIYLAGGLGTNLSEDDVLDTGILPETWRERIVPIGNGALQGAIQVGKINVTEGKKVSKWNQSNEDVLKADMKIGNEQYQNIGNIKKNAKTISLAEHVGFQEKYLRNMNF